MGEVCDVADRLVAGSKTLAAVLRDSEPAGRFRPGPALPGAKWW